MMVIGITGNFGTGKTFVASIFASLGAKVLDADRIAHDAIRIGRPAYRRVVSIFGRTILDKEGNIERERLADIVFSSKEDLEKLNRIVHPEVIKVIKREIAGTGKAGVIVIDAPLLIEANLTGLVDKLIVVKSSRRTQIERCTKRFCIKKEDVLKRIGHQIPIGKKIKMADFVIDNNGTRSETRDEVRKAWRRMYGNS